MRLKNKNPAIAPVLACGASGGHGIGKKKKKKKEIRSNICFLKFCVLERWTFTEKRLLGINFLHNAFRSFVLQHAISEINVLQEIS